MRKQCYTILLLFVSCATHKNVAENSPVDLLKKYAYTKCMEQSIATFSIRDTLEMGSGEVRNLLDYNGIFTNNLDGLLDSLAQTVVKEQMDAKQRYKDKHESAVGRTSYLIGCLNFYHSKRLDSIIRRYRKISI